MQNSFRSGFIFSGIITLASIPMIFVGFFPLTLIMGFISLTCLVLWIVMRIAYGKEDAESKTTPETYAAPIDTSKIIVGEENKSNDSN